MTTIPGLNQILPQSSIAQEVSNQGSTLKPSPDQLVAQQQVQKVIQESTVQDSEESERLKEEKEKQKKRELELKQKAARKKKKKINQDEERMLDPDAPGRLLDTTV
ncbi:MAG: hypothetical protein GY710_06900 [Desulfobacteraceae bacterium]|nr:hypothetical protein [Desulfobacteraceae bacterium]